MPFISRKVLLIFEKDREFDMLPPKNTTTRCCLKRVPIPEPIKKVYRKMKESLRAAFKKSDKEGAKNDVAKASDPLPGARQEMRSCGITKCPYCPYTIQVDPVSLRPVFLEGPRDHRTPIERNSLPPLLSYDIPRIRVPKKIRQRRRPGPTSDRVPKEGTSCEPNTSVLKA